MIQTCPAAWWSWPVNYRQLTRNKKKHDKWRARRRERARIICGLIDHGISPREAWALAKDPRGNAMRRSTTGPDGDDRNEREPDWTN